MFNYACRILAHPVAANSNRNALTHSPVIQFWGLTLSMHTTGLTHIIAVLLLLYTLSMALNAPSSSLDLSLSGICPIQNFHTQPRVKSHWLLNQPRWLGHL